MIDKNQPKAITVEYSKIVELLETQCGVCAAYNPEFEQNINPTIRNFNALWDTGANFSIISTNVVQTLNLKSDGIATILHADGESIVKTYLVKIILPNDIGAYILDVAEGSLTSTDVLIGMDIISKGDFCVTTSQGITKFSFQIPSTHDTDYTKEIND